MSRSTHNPSYARELSRRRARMDRLNAKLRDALQERARMALAIARWKQEHGVGVADVARERDMLDRLLAHPGEGFDADVLARLLRAIFRASRRLAEEDSVVARPTAGKHAATRSARSVRGSALHRSIWNVVQRIPRGRVATYGQIAALAGLGSNARLVGYALHALPEGSAVPWHRVVNARGGISLPQEQYPLQRALLEAERIVFVQDRIDLTRYGWNR